MALRTVAPAGRATTRRAPFGESFGISKLAQVLGAPGLARIAERLDHGAAAVPASLEQDRSDDSGSNDLLPGHLWSINYCSDVYDVYFSCNDMLKCDDILCMSLISLGFLHLFFLCGL